MANADATADVRVLTKRCGTCKDYLALDLFHKNKNGRLGAASRCKPCAREAARAWHKANQERANATSAAFRAANPDYGKVYLGAYYQRHKDQIKARVRAREKALGAALRPVNAARALRRIAARLQATPSWADHREILAVYERAAEVSRKTGVPHHVDHIVPLQSRLVCGLHTPANLRVLPKAENQSKSNRWWPDMP